MTGAHGQTAPIRLGIWGDGRLGSAVRALAAGQGAAGDTEGPTLPDGSRRAESAWTVTFCHGRRHGSSTSTSTSTSLASGVLERERPDVLVDASVADAVEEHLELALAWQRPLVIAATGWRIADLAERVGERIGVVVAPNGSLAMALVEGWARQLAAYAARVPGADGYLLDHHHAAKRDAPSGTAERLASAWREGWQAADGERANRSPQVASIRAGHEIGAHVLGFDGPDEQIEIHHRARSRRIFAQGLLAAARWVRGRRGVFGMADVVAPLLPPATVAGLAASTAPADVSDRVVPTVGACARQAGRGGSEAEALPSAEVLPSSEALRKPGAGARR